jgi:hypothetical protein
MSWEGVEGANVKKEQSKAHQKKRIQQRRFVEMRKKMENE